MGKRISVQVSYIDAAGYQETVSSPMSNSVISAFSNPPTGEGEHAATDEPAPPPSANEPPPPTVALDLDTGVSNADRVTAQGVLKLTGVEPGATVQYQLNGATWNSTLNLVEGNNEVYVRQLVDGVASKPSNALQFVLDTTAPSSALFETVAIDNRINASEAENATINGTAEAHAQVELTLGANIRRVSADGNGAWSYQLTNADLVSMGEGPETLSVSQTDAAGNSGVASTAIIAIDLSLIHI